MIYVNHQTTSKLIQEFINDSYSGRRLTIKGTRLADGSVINYLQLQRSQLQFCKAKKHELRVYIAANLSVKKQNNANLCYIKFYKELTDYLYDELHFFDNYVGLIIKCYRTFMNHLELEKQVLIGNFSFKIIVFR